MTIRDSHPFLLFTFVFFIKKKKKYSGPIDLSRVDHMNNAFLKSKYIRN